MESEGEEELPGLENVLEESDTSVSEDTRVSGEEEAGPVDEVIEDSTEVKEADTVEETDEEESN